jgi:hypothetical protein
MKASPPTSSAPPPEIRSPLFSRKPSEWQASIAVVGGGIFPKTSREAKSVCVDSSDVGPRSLERGGRDVGKDGVLWRVRMEEAWRIGQYANRCESNWEALLRKGYLWELLEAPDWTLEVAWWDIPHRGFEHNDRDNRVQDDGTIFLKESRGLVSPGVGEQFRTSVLQHLSPRSRSMCEPIVIQLTRMSNCLRHRDNYRDQVYCSTAGKTFQGHQITSRGEKGRILGGEGGEIYTHQGP